MTWIEPIFDRTKSDIDYAYKVIEEAKRSENKRNIWGTFVWGTVKWGNNFDFPDLKGCMNYTDFNRIEQDINYIADILTNSGYYVTIETKQWNMSDKPRISDIERIIKNVNSILNTFYKDPNSPNVPTNMNNYLQVNDLEENLFFLEKLLKKNIDSFLECGTFECGEM